MVDFQELNLVRAWPPLPRMDLVFLRNVMIYFDVETKKAILGRMAGVLQTGRLSAPGRGGDDIQPERFLPAPRAVQDRVLSIDRLSHQAAHRGVRARAGGGFGHRGMQRRAAGVAGSPRTARGAIHLGRKLDTCRDGADRAWSCGLSPGRRGSRSQSDINAVLGLAGQEGSGEVLVLSFPAETARRSPGECSSKSHQAPDDELIRDCMGELANVIAGQAKTLLAETPYQLLLGTPTILLGRPASRLPHRRVRSAGGGYRDRRRRFRAPGLPRPGCGARAAPPASTREFPAMSHARCDRSLAVIQSTMRMIG